MNNIQPYLLAYMKIHNITELIGIKSWDYIAWIKSKHWEFRKLKGLRELEPYNKIQEEEFIKFINEVGK